LDFQEIKETPIWVLYEKGRNYHRMMNIYSDTDKNYNFYNGNQWAGAKLGDVEPVQKNFINRLLSISCRLSMTICLLSTTPLRTMRTPTSVRLLIDTVRC